MSPSNPFPQTSGNLAEEAERMEEPEEMEDIGNKAPLSKLTGSVHLQSHRERSSGHGTFT